MQPEERIPIWKMESTWTADIARRLSDHRFPTVEHAALRRMNPTRVGGGAAVSVERLLARVGMDSSGEDWQRWALIIHCLALARGAHNPAARTGSLLAEAHYSELRLNRMLIADEEVVFDILPRLARFVASKGIAIDWLPLAQVARWVGRNEDRADRAKLQLARDFARATSKEDRE